MDVPRRYKRYLEAGSDEPIPSTSFYRFKKLLGKKGEEYLESHYEHHTDEPMEISEHFDNNEIDKEILIENFQTSTSNNINDEERISNIMKSLVDEIDLIENEVTNNAEEENEPDDFFFAASDDAFEDPETDEVNENSKSFTSLQDLIDNELFKGPIAVKANKTIGEVILMILKYVLVHALSLTETTDLFLMINCIFAESFLPATRYLIDKLFYPKNTMTLHATCSKCGSYVGKFDRSTQFLMCKICKTKINVKDQSYKDFFVMMNIASPISKLIEANSEYYNNVMNNRVNEKGRFRDIYDGRKYREFVKSLSDSDKNKYATVIFNTDGAPLFQSSSHSIWPIFLMVNEVPFNVRTKELILAGLWFGKGKPNMNVFLEPYVDEMYNLSTKGVECIINGVKIVIKNFNLICCVDSVARAPVQGFTQFNGKYGCSLCLHPGEWVTNNNNSNKRSGNIKYPMMKEAPKKRNVEDTLKHMNEASNSKEPIFGVKSPSQLINLLNYDIIYGCVVEPLHCCAGIAKQFAVLWFGTLKKAGILSKSHIPEIDKIMASIKAPNQVSRLTRAFSEKAFWKGREWENWTLYYSLVVLQEIVPDNLLMHWALFVEAIYILSKQECTIHEIDYADRLLHEFVGRVESLYTKVSMTFNVHLLLHLAKSVLDWGPLWCHNAYAFESGNGDLLKIIHAAKGVHNQICRQISLKYSFLRLKDHIYSFSSFPVRYYCDTIGTKVAKKTVQTENVRYFGSPSQPSTSWSQKLNLSTFASSYKKIVKYGCLYTSSIKINQRSNNSFAQLQDGTYVMLNSFIVDTSIKSEYTVIRVIQTSNAHGGVYPMLRKIDKINKEEIAVPTDSIARICVHIKNENTEYICALPNLCHY